MIPPVPSLAAPVPVPTFAPVIPAAAHNPGLSNTSTKISHPFELPHKINKKTYNIKKKKQTNKKQNKKSSIPFYSYTITLPGLKNGLLSSRHVVAAHNKVSNKINLFLSFAN